MFSKTTAKPKLELSCSFRCEQIHGNHSLEYGHTLLSCLSTTYMFNKPTSQASLLNKSSWLAAALGVTKFITIIAMILVTLKSILDVKQTNLWGPFIEQKLKLNCSLRRDRLLNSDCNELYKSNQPQILNTFCGTFCCSQVPLRYSTKRLVFVFIVCLVHHHMTMV